MSEISYSQNFADLRSIMAILELSNLTAIKNNLNTTQKTYNAYKFFIFTKDHYFTI